jgi:hypothetical protein
VGQSESPIGRFRCPILFASSEKFVGDGERQRAVSLRNLRNFRQVESNDFC